MTSLPLRSVEREGCQRDEGTLGDVADMLGWETGNEMGVRLRIVEGFLGPLYSFKIAYPQLSTHSQNYLKSWHTTPAPQRCVPLQTQKITENIKSCVKKYIKK